MAEGAEPVDPVDGAQPGAGTGDGTGLAEERELTLLRFLVGVDVVLLACYLFVLLYFVIGITRIGPQDPLVGFNGARYPRDLIPFRDHPANPFSWLYHLLAWVFRGGAPLVLTVAVGSLIGAWRGRLTHPQVARRLLYATAGLAVALAVAVSPLGAEIRLWLLY